MLMLYHGNNSYLSWLELTDKLLQQKLEWQSVQGDELTNVSGIFANGDNFSMFKQKPGITIVKRFFANKKKSLQQELLEKLQSSKYSFELIFWEDKEIELKSNKLLNYLKKHGEVKLFKPLRLDSLKKWFKEYITELKITMTSGQMETILARAGTDQGVVVSELEKLKLLLLSEKRTRVTAADLEIISLNEEATIWEFLEVVSKRNRAEILQIFQELIRQGNDLQYIIAMIARQLKIIFLVKQQGTHNFHNLAVLGINPYSYGFRQIQQNSNKFEISQLKILFKKLAALDFAIKQGRIDPYLGTNLFLATI